MQVLSKVYIKKVMEYVDVADHRDLIENLKSEEIKKIMFQLLQGLRHCH